MKLSSVQLHFIHRDIEDSVPPLPPPLPIPRKVCNTSTNQNSQTTSRLPVPKARTQTRQQPPNSYVHCSPTLTPAIVSGEFPCIHSLRYFSTYVFVHAQIIQFLLWYVK